MSRNNVNFFGRFLLLSLGVLIISCGTVKQADIASKDEGKKIVLPPDVPSNKYSKKRQNNPD